MGATGENNWWEQACNTESVLHTRKANPIVHLQLLEQNSKSRVSLRSNKLFRWLYSGVTFKYCCVNFFWRPDFSLPSISRYHVWVCLTDNGGQRNQPPRFYSWTLCNRRKYTKTCGEEPTSRRYYTGNNASEQCREPTCSIT